MAGFVIGLLTVVEVILALMLIGLILIQPGKAGGGLGAIGGDMTQSVFGAGTGTVLSKATTYIATGFLVVTLLLAILTGHRKTGGSIAEQMAAETTPAQTLEAAADSETATDAQDAAEEKATESQSQ